MADAPNGLASMTQARERRTRRAMPPPRHPASIGSADAGPSQEAASILEDAATVKEPDRVEAQEPKSVKSPAPRTVIRTTKSVTLPPPAEIPAVGEGVAPRPATVYLDERHIDFLEQAKIAGLVSRPRLDISKSAVVRLALERLQRDMTVEQIRDYLRAQPTDPTKTGRKRR